MVLLMFTDPSSSRLILRPNLTISVDFGGYGQAVGIVEEMDVLQLV